MTKLLAGFDIGGTKCAFCLGTADGKPFDKIKFATEPGFDAVWQAMILTAAKMLERHNLTWQDIAAIGVSCGGPLDSRQGVVMSPPNLPGWDNIPLVKLLEDEFKVPAFLMNDANACALAEWRFGAGDNVENMIFLTMGTGLGGGIIVNNDLYEGRSGMAGEIGHIRLKDSGPVGFGKEGSFEGFCGGSGIARHAEQIAAEYPDQQSVKEYIAMTGSANYSMRNLDLAQACGNEFARHMFDVTGDMLGQGLSILIDAFNPDRIVIGSIFARSEELLRPAMQAALCRETLGQSLNDCQILPAKLGDDIGDYAALLVARYGLEHGAKDKGTDFWRPEIEEIFDDLFVRYPVLKECGNDIRRMYEMLAKCFANGGKLLICGNGGSASDAQHIVGELMKDFAVRRGVKKSVADKFTTMFPDGSGSKLAEQLTEAMSAVSLSGECALETAMANDVGADMVYAQQVYGLCNTGDIVLGLSTSGNSGNVVNAIKTAAVKGGRSLAITGGRDSQLSEICDVTIKLPESETYLIQELTLPVYHTLCLMLEKNLVNGMK